MTPYQKYRLKQIARVVGIHMALGTWHFGVVALFMWLFTIPFDRSILLWGLCALAMWDARQTLIRMGWKK